MNGIERLRLSVHVDEDDILPDVAAQFDEPQSFTVDVGMDIVPGAAHMGRRFESAVQVVSTTNGSGAANDAAQGFRFR